MRSPGSPSASARCALSIAETTSASRITASAERGLAVRRVLVHHPREQVGVEAAPVDADAHRLAVLERLLDHRRELRVALAALAHVAGIDPQLGERAGAVRVLPPGACGR